MARTASHVTVILIMKSTIIKKIMIILKIQIKNIYFPNNSTNYGGKFCGMLKKAFNVSTELQINVVLDTKVCLLNLKLPVSR